MASVRIMAPLHYRPILDRFSAMILAGGIFLDVIRSTLRSGSIPIRSVACAGCLVSRRLMCLIARCLARCGKQNADKANQTKYMFQKPVSHTHIFFFQNCKDTLF
jgi:hypothetical protein